MSSPSFPAGYFISLFPCGIFHLPRSLPSLQGILYPSFPVGYFISLAPCAVFHLPRSPRGISYLSFPAGYFIFLAPFRVVHLLGNPSPFIVLQCILSANTIPKAVQTLTQKILIYATGFLGFRDRLQFFKVISVLSKAKIRTKNVFLLHL